MGFCMALSMNSVGIPGGFRGNAGFRENLGFGEVSGDLGGQKAFAQIASAKCPTLKTAEKTAEKGAERVPVLPAVLQGPTRHPFRLFFRLHVFNVGHLAPL